MLPVSILYKVRAPLWTARTLCKILNIKPEGSSY